MMQCGRSMVIVKSWCNRFGQRSQYSSEEALKAVLQTVEPKVTPEVNSCLLISLPDLEEIKGVVFACGRFKALGLDGLPPHCFQQFWDDTKDVLFRWFSKLLKIPHANLPKRYLGVPMNFDTPKIVMFNNLVDQTITQLQHWKTSILSPAGKEILIKSVALPKASYLCSIFKLPATLLQILRKEMATFYWSHGRKDKAIHWISWTRLCLPKNKGGLGMRDPILQNLALLAKLAWRIWKTLTVEWVKCLKAIYYPSSDFLDATLGHNPFWLWRSICEGLGVLKKCLIWTVGDGTRIRIWEDAWVPTLQF